MGFDRDEFDNEINNTQELTTNTENTTEISNTNTADEIGIDTQSEQKDIDSIIKRHTDSLAKAAENIAKNEAESGSSVNTVSLDKTDTNEEVNNNANIEGNSRETYRTTQSEDVRARALTAQPQKVQSKGKERKKSKVGKAVGLVASAAVFALVAGGVMVGVNTVANSYISSNVETKDNIVIGNQTDIKSDSESTAAPATNLSNMDVSTIVDKAMPSVVAIYGKAEITQNSFFGTQSYEAQSSGSGIIVGKTDTELLVVTNNHVIADTDSLEVEFNDGTKAAASVKGGDSDNDVAVVAIKLSDLSEDTLSKISIANIGDSNDIKVGQGVVAIGNALGYGQSVTVGYISALNREVKTEGGTSRNLLQTDAAINPGN